MEYLIDTNTFLFWTSNSPKLSSDARKLLASAKSDLAMSAVSAWEISIKYGLGKLKLPEPPITYVPSRLRQHRIEAISVEHNEALQVARLPNHHDDPFDRLLIAQALHRRMPVVTSDSRFEDYRVLVIW
jgi:PIN domain nuclease of toxin-antitoxin system